MCLGLGRSNSELKVYRFELFKVDNFTKAKTLEKCINYRKYTARSQRTHLSLSTTLFYHSTHTYELRKTRSYKRIQRLQSIVKMVYKRKQGESKYLHKTLKKKIHFRKVQDKKRHLYIKNTKLVSIINDEMVLN